ncbi:probable protein phosphatase 2C 55 isoform X2 [Aristolochia californica]|uniref:probable protein phosphatase 2C 55 isoform X2 n=1 Tax=Aristolochia californica TaxID=171875 RepID=UPI0035E15E05
MPSAYFSRLNTVLRSRTYKSIEGHRGLENSVEYLFGQIKLFGKSTFPFSRPLSTLVSANLFSRSTTYSLRSDPCVVDQERALSVVGALSRTFSIPSVSGPSCQVCLYHIDSPLLGSPQSSLINQLQRKMASYGSLSTQTELAARSLENVASKGKQLLKFGNKANLSYRNKSLHCYRKASMSLRNREPCPSKFVYGFFLLDSNETRWIPGFFTAPGAKNFHNSSFSPQSAGAAPDVSFDGSAREEQLANATTSSDQKVPGDRALKLLSGSCYLPHPDKEETGGEDAHFICVDEHAIGVADGVGGWADLGIDAGQYARELMSHSVRAIQEEPKGSIDPARVLEKAHSSTKAKGSSTACIIALTDQGLHAINLGDSGFIVVRDGCTIFRSPVQQHDFNFTYQLASGNDSDLPSSGQVFTIPVVPGDVIIAGTDGLFDNLYNNEVTAVVVHAVRAGLGPQVTAQKIAALARQRAQDKNRQTPFSTAAQDAGYRYYGGKLDDITVVVSYITSSNA